jgi:hypothetical protein
MVKTTVYLDDEDVQALRAISKRSTKPQAQLIREAIHNFTSGARRPLPAGLGMFDSGHTDTASRRKEIMKAAALAGKWRS